MSDLDRQVDYWNRTGPSKTFSHPVNFERLSEWLTSTSCIVDVGCGYGRTLQQLYDHGFQNLIGFDPASEMIAVARDRCPTISFQELSLPPQIPLPDASVDGTLLFSVLTCVPTDQGQQAIIDEVLRVLRPGGFCYISDLWLQTDERNISRYVRDQEKYGKYGVFDLPEGVTVRHHDPGWIEILTSAFETGALDNLTVRTMNGNPADAFQWFGLKRS